MQGFKTVITGAVLAIVPPLTDYLGMVDWSFLGENTGFVVGGVLMVLLRAVTKTPIFDKDPE